MKALALQSVSPLNTTVFNHVAIEASHMCSFKLVIVTFKCFLFRRRTKNNTDVRPR